MVRHSSRQVRTYTLGFNYHGYDETEQAHLVAEKLGTAHHQAIVSEEEAMRVVPDLGSLYDEPFADSSQIPTVLISRFARQSVTVALTGDGGDEVFGGYPRHSSAALWYGRVKRYPPAFRTLIGTSLYYLLDTAGNLTLYLTPALNDTVRKFSKISKVLCSQTLAESYMEWVSHWRPADLIFQENRKHADITNEAFVRNAELNDVDRELMLIDSLTYLVDEMLVKVDRAAMSASLETRAPFLDHELVEFAWTLPKRLIINGAERKGLLRKLVEKRIAPITLKSLKSGFSVPLGSWLRGGLRDWAEAMLEAHPTAADCLNDYVIKRVWRNHMRGNEDNSSLLWAVLMFKSWASHRML